ncbi:MAG: DUF983 domain-containing protein [Defluviicoccus sp.]|nr:DUF983 domain-containing protein [Defluviicoccus sp.]
MVRPGVHPPRSPIATGLACRCPRCGAGSLYDGLLTVADKCEACGLDFGPHDSGDGPAVFTIPILGAVVVALAFWLEMLAGPPFWVHIAIWPPAIVVLALAMLRRVKGLLVAFHYKNLRHEYDERD